MASHRQTRALSSSKGRRAILNRGAPPLGLPSTLTRGGPMIPAPFAWLTRCRSFALRELVASASYQPRGSALLARQRGQDLPGAIS